MTTSRLLRLSIAAAFAGSLLTLQAQSLRLPGVTGAAPAASTQRASDYIVAVVNSEPITNMQVRQEVQRLGQQLAQQQQNVPTPEQLAEQALERLIMERSQVQFARDSGIKIDDGALDEAELTVARQNQVDVAEMYRQLSETGMSRSLFRNNLRDQLLVNRVRDREVGQRVKVSELDIDQYLIEQRRNTSSALAEVNIAHILLALPESPSTEQVATAQAAAQRIVERVRAGEDFSGLARAVSQAPDAAAGGLFGMRPADRYPQLFTDAVRSLEPDAMAVVRSGAGIHVLRLLEKRVVGAPAATAVQTRASHILLRPSATLSESAAIARLDEYRQRILSDRATFDAVAKEFSQDASAAQGGDLGWAVQGQFVPEFEDTMAALAPGDISAPLVSRFGVHLIRVVERKTVQRSAREQREAVRAVLREKKFDEAYRIWSSELRARAYVDVREPPS